MDVLLDDTFLAGVGSRMAAVCAGVDGAKSGEEVGLGTEGSEVLGVISVSGWIGLGDCVDSLAAEIGSGVGYDSGDPDVKIGSGVGVDIGVCLDKVGFGARVGDEFVTEDAVSSVGFVTEDLVEAASGG